MIWKWGRGGWRGHIGSTWSGSGEKNPREKCSIFAPGSLMWLFSLHPQVRYKNANISMLARWRKWAFLDFCKHMAPSYTNSRCWSLSSQPRKKPANWEWSIHGFLQDTRCCSLAHNKLHWWAKTSPIIKGSCIGWESRSCRLEMKEYGLMKNGSHPENEDKVYFATACGKHREARMTTVPWTWSAYLCKSPWVCETWAYEKGRM